MVRLFTSSTKAPSNPRNSISETLVAPPPYHESASASPLPVPVILAETTTTRTQTITTTTTETTTHFFSLPLWRKRPELPSPVVRQHSSDTAWDHHAGPSSRPLSSLYMVNKDLPPTPPPQTFGDDHALNGHIFGELGERRAQTIVQPGRADSGNIAASLPSSSSTAALAKAALGLGLPHVLPSVSTSPSSGTNTVSFKGPASPVTNPQLSSPSVRKAKSTQRIDTRNSSDSLDEFGSANGRRRTRGISFGTNSFLHFGGNDAKGKEKEKNKEVDGEGEGVSQNSPKTLSRRPSFWTRARKKSGTYVDPPVPVSTTTSSLHVIPPLPVMQPVSPFDVDLPKGGSSSTRHARTLSRSHSARESLRRSSFSNADHLNSHIGPVPVSKRREQIRPMTADSASRRQNSRKLLSDSSGLPMSPPISVPLPQVDENRRSFTSTHGMPSRTRPRSQTNPPLLHRLSLGVFSSLEPPLPTEPSPDIGAGSKPAMLARPVDIPKPLENEESPDIYLTRLRAAVTKAEIAGILASSADPFYAQALRVYISQFDFVDDPLDVALRKLLMEVGLPRETQQIDRVIEAFAVRYMQCNPALFASEDHPYILAFSLIMLHTDAFNKSNKRKMTKADYIKNTKLPGVVTEVLDCFYDNIVFAPFIFIEDPLDVNGQRGLTQEFTTSRSSTSVTTPLTSPTTNSGSTLIPRANKVDPYYLITNNLLGSLRVEVESYIPLEDPYSYEGTAGSWDADELQRAFANANIIEVALSDLNRGTPVFSLSVAGGPPNPAVSTMGALPEIPPSTGEVLSLKVTKVGSLNRKDDVLVGGKKASNRKWRSWSAILTGSQLLFFRDTSWATTLLDQSESSKGHITLPYGAVFRPDEILSVKDAIAVFDSSYTRYENTLRFAMPDGRQLLLQTSDQSELNDWIAKINYASAFKSAGVRMRSLGMSGRDFQLTGVAAATSHLHDIQRARIPAQPSHEWDTDAPADLMGMLSGESPQRPNQKRRVTIMSGGEDVDFDVPVAPEVEGADQFKATFDLVKADLAAGHVELPDQDFSQPLQRPVRVSDAEPISISPISARGEGSRLPSRSQIIQSKIQELESNVTVSQAQLDSDMRLLRNVATLTPFQKATRDRLTLAVQGIAKRVMQVRLLIVRLTCHRDVLSRDLEAENRSWNQAKKIALTAAKETLQSRRMESIPLMTLSLHDDELGISSSPSHPTYGGQESPSHRRRESSTCGSFHSAIDFGPDWPSSEDLSSSFLYASQLVDSPRPSISGSLSSFPFPEDAGASSSASNGPFSSEVFPSPSSPPGDAVASHERFYTAQEGSSEQAEIWSQTRCAQRVSLVRVPSNIRMSTRFGKQITPPAQGQ